MQTLTIRGRLKLVLNSVGGQKELAKLIEVSPSTLGNWAQGKAGLSLDTIELICSRTEISPAWLAFGEDPMRKEAGGGEFTEEFRRGLPDQEPMDEDTARLIRLLGAENERLKAQVFGEAVGEPVLAQATGTDAGAEGALPLMVGKYFALQEEHKALEGKHKEAVGEIERLKTTPLAPVGTPPPPPMPMLGLAECGIIGWNETEPTNMTVPRPPTMLAESDFAVSAIGQSLYFAGIDDGFVCFCSPSTPVVRDDIVYVQDDRGYVSLGLLKEENRRAKGEDWLVLQKWDDEDENKQRKPYVIEIVKKSITKTAPVLYVFRRGILDLYKKP